MAFVMTTTIAALQKQQSLKNKNRKLNFIGSYHGYFFASSLFTVMLIFKRSLHERIFQ
jgi:hypothetical protein